MLVQSDSTALFSDPQSRTRTGLPLLRVGRPAAPTARSPSAAMTQTTTGQARLKAGLPPAATLAHKTGTGRTDLGVNPATNDIGVITLKDGRRYAVAVFLAGSPAGDAERDAIIADVARAVVRAAG